MPSIVPDIDEGDIHLVLNSYGPLGIAYVETDPCHADRETIIRLLSEGQFTHPVRVVRFNVAAGTACDVSEAIAEEVIHRVWRAGKTLPPETHDFVRFHLGLLNEAFPVK